MSAGRGSPTPHPPPPPGRSPGPPVPPAGSPFPPQDTAEFLRPLTLTLRLALPDPAGPALDEASPTVIRTQVGGGPGGGGGPVSPRGDGGVPSPPRSPSSRTAGRTTSASPTWCCAPPCSPWAPGTACPQRVPNVCPHHVSVMSPVCPQCVPKMSPMCPHCVPSVSPSCPSVSPLCPLHVPNVSPMCPQRVPIVFPVCLQRVPHVSPSCPHGTPPVSPRNLHCVPKLSPVTPGCPHGVLESLWCPCSIPRMSPKRPCSVSIVSPCCPNEVSPRCPHPRGVPAFRHAAAFSPQRRSRRGAGRPPEGARGGGAAEPKGERVQRAPGAALLRQPALLQHGAAGTSGDPRDPRREGGAARTARTRGAVWMRSIPARRGGDVGRGVRGAAGIPAGRWESSDGSWKTRTR